MVRRTLYERGLVAAFFLTLAVVGLLVYDEYGIAWDEPGLVHYGNLLLDHYAPGGGWETFMSLRFYGPVGALALALTDRLTGGPAFPAGHLTNFAFYFTAVAVFYALCRYQFRDRMWGLLGAAFLVLSPRVFSHGFVNPKDVPLMTGFVVAVYLLVRFLDSGRRRWIVLCGVATAVATAVRVAGIFLVVLAIAAVAADLVARRRRDPEWRSTVWTSAITLGLYVLVFTAGTIALWPFLWENPVVRFYEAAKVMGNFLEGPSSVLHQGRILPATEVPWHYLPVWMGVTTPPLYIGLTLVGILSLRRPRRAFVERTRDRFLFLYVCWAFLPLVAVAVAGSPLYDDSRMALFVYPAFLLLAVAGAREIARWVTRTRGRRPLADAAVGLLAASLLWTFGTTVRLHPYQTAYFNVLAGDAPQERFDVDYWGLSYREALERLLNLETGRVVLYVCSGPGRDNAELIEPERAERLQYVETIADARYTLCAPRASLGAWDPGGEPLFTIERDGIPLLFAHRLRPGYSLPRIRSSTVE
ncbi:MAG: glycosyltransferase family 39 protein [Actinomycetota bacterium]|nr:glycosyltransferase family 39 protein [Actinomycetota bacterium]